MFFEEGVTTEGGTSESDLRAKLEDEWRRGALTREQFEALVLAQDAYIEIDRVLDSLEYRKGLRLRLGIAPTF